MWEKEAYAVCWALLTWCHFLEGSKVPFEVWADHKNLEALRTPWKLLPKQVQWAQYFNWLSFSLKYIPGEKNLLADALSQMPQYNSKCEEVVHAMISSPQRVMQATTWRQVQRR